MPAAPSARCSGATATTATAGRPGPTSPARSAARRPAWSADSRVDCFATTPAHHLAQISYDGTAWSAWADRGGAVQDRPSCVAGSGTALDCFAWGTDKTLYRLPFDGKKWAAWQKVGGSLAARPECVAFAGGIDCFAVDAKKNLQLRRLASGKWGSWTELAIGAALGAGLRRHRHLAPLHHRERHERPAQGLDQRHALDRVDRPRREQRRHIALLQPPSMPTATG